MNSSSPSPNLGTDDKAIVENYFNTVGFDRWQRIYRDGEVNRVQKDIRIGHQQTIDSVVAWLTDDGNLSGLTICDAGCGVGSLTIPLAAAGAKVFASDLSEKMVGEARVWAQEALPPEATQPQFTVKDLESLSGQYHTVICLDVLIHYPDEKIGEMIQHLQSLATHRLILSFAPKTCFYATLKKVGDFFPGPSKATRAYLHRESEICNILTADGWQVKRTAMSKTRFYFSRLIEVVKPESV